MSCLALFLQPANGPNILLQTREWFPPSCALSALSAFRQTRRAFAVNKHSTPDDAYAGESIGDQRPGHHRCRESLPRHVLPRERHLRARHHRRRPRQLGELVRVHPHRQSGREHRGNSVLRHRRHAVETQSQVRQ